MHPTYRGLALLLSLGSLPVACSNDDTDTDNTGGTPGTNPTANTGTGTSTGTGTGTGTDATDPTATTPTTGPDVTTTTGSTGGIDTDTTAPDPTTTTGPNTGDTGDTDTPPASDPTCIAFAAHLIECMPRYVRYQEQYAAHCEFWKNHGLRTDGLPCADAHDAFYVCLSMVSCAETKESGACADEHAEISEACPS